MEGYEVMTMDQAAPLGDVFICATGCNKVITKRHMERMKDGVILANAGHFDVEVDKTALEELAVEIKERKAEITGYRTADGRWLNLLAEGRLVNLAAGNGHPAEIMDLSFSIQALSLEWLTARRTLAAGVYEVPAEIDEAVARVKLESMGVEIDTLTEEQENYLKGF